MNKKLKVTIEVFDNVDCKFSDKKLKVTIKITDNVDSKYPDTKIYIEENLK